MCKFIAKSVGRFEKTNTKRTKNSKTTRLMLISLCLYLRICSTKCLILLLNLMF